MATTSPKDAERLGGGGKIAKRKKKNLRWGVESFALKGRRQKRGEGINKTRRKERGGKGAIQRVLGLRIWARGGGGPKKKPPITIFY